MTSGFHRLHSLRMENDQKGFDMEDMRPRFERIANRHENGTTPRAVSAYQLFQTPPAVAGLLVDLLQPKPGGRFLEPSAGLGRLLDVLAPFHPSEVVAVEQAASCAGELFKQEREGVTIKQRDFLACSVDDLGLFDAIAMNPPFHMRSDIAHIRHALQFLATDGSLTSVCMDTKHRREAFPDAEWHTLPEGSFKSSNTNVPTAIVVFRPFIVQP